MADAGYKI